MFNEELQSLPNHAFGSCIPNIVFDLGLTPYELAIYALIKCKRGTSIICTLSHQEIAEKVGCSKAHVKTCLRKLQLPISKLGGLPLLEIKRGRISESGKTISNTILVLDIWQVNGDYYRNEKNSSVESTGS